MCSFLNIDAEAATSVQIEFQQPKGTATATVSANLSDTLSWGGITSVTDAMTGQPIDEWTITSDSGFDYSLVFLIPEPSSLLLFVLAIVAVATSLPSRSR